MPAIPNKMPNGNVDGIMIVGGLGSMIGRFFARSKYASRNHSTGMILVLRSYLLKHRGVTRRRVRWALLDYICFARFLCLNNWVYTDVWRWKLVEGG